MMPSSSLGSWTSSSVNADVCIIIVNIELAYPTIFHVIGLSKVSPTRATEIGSVCLVGDFNPKVLGLAQLDKSDGKCPQLAHVFPNMLHKVTPCMARDDLRKIEKTNNYILKCME